MPSKCLYLHGVRILECAADGKKLESDRDAVELIGEAGQLDAELVAIPVERLADDFFRLRTGVAGAIIQKFVTYWKKLAVIGDISAHVAQSTAFRDFVYEANRGDQVWFVENAEELEQKLRQRLG